MPAEPKAGAGAARRAATARGGAFTSTTWTHPYTDLSDEHVRLVGVPKAEQPHVPLPAPRRIAQSLERRIEESHLRAGRALLGWSMSDLAAASGLSLSTVRRMDGGEGRGMRSVSAAVAALRRAGVAFTLAENGGIVLGKRP